MRTFKIIVMVAWIAVALNLILSMASTAYSRHVPSEIEGLLLIAALVLFSASSRPALPSGHGSLEASAGSRHE